MTTDEYLAIESGIYRVFWSKKHGGGESIAAIGVTHNGERWIAPTNWLWPSTLDPKMVDRVEPLVAATTTGSAAEVADEVSLAAQLPEPARLDTTAIAAARLTDCTCGSTDELGRHRPGLHTRHCAKFAAAWSVHQSKKKARSKRGTRNGH